MPLQLQILHFLRIAQVAGVNDAAILFQIIDNQLFRMLFQETGYNAATGKQVPGLQPVLPQAAFHLFQSRTQEVKQGTLVTQIRHNLFRQVSGIFLHLRRWEG